MNPTLAAASATVKASTSATMETASSVEASTEARLPARRESSGDTSVTKAAERTGMTTRLDMRRGRSVLRSYKSMLRG